MAAKPIIILVGPDYEDLEVWYPKLRLEEAGYTALLVGTSRGEIRGKHGYPCQVEATIDEIEADTALGVVVPGGWAPDKLRRDERVLQLVRQLDQQGKLIASICHGPWVLISAGILSGRKVTGSAGIRDDVRNAGATWLDEPAVIDGHLVTARVPADLPAFARATLAVLQRQLNPR